MNTLHAQHSQDVKVTSGKKIKSMYAKDKGLTQIITCYYPNPPCCTEPTVNKCSEKQERWSEIPLITVVWKEKQQETTAFQQGEISIS